MIYIADQQPVALPMLILYHNIVLSESINEVLLRKTLLFIFPHEIYLMTISSEETQHGNVFYDKQI